MQKETYSRSPIPIRMLAKARLNNPIYGSQIMVTIPDDKVWADMFCNQWEVINIRSKWIPKYYRSLDRRWWLIIANFLLIIITSQSLGQDLLEYRQIFQQSKIFVNFCYDCFACVVYTWYCFFHDFQSYHHDLVTHTVKKPKNLLSEKCCFRC